MNAFEKERYQRAKQDFMLCGGNLQNIKELKNLSVVEKFEFLELFTNVNKKTGDKTRTPKSR